MKLLCKLNWEWGQKVSVGGKVLTIGTDGSLEVDAESAALLLQNKGKWVSAEEAAKEEPFKKGRARAEPILMDRAGNILSSAETAEVLKKAEAPVTPVEKPTKPAKVKEPEPVVVEEAWPIVDNETPKGELIQLLDRLQKAGYVKANSYSAKLSTSKLLSAIEKGYGAMS